MPEARYPNNPTLSTAQCGVTVAPRADGVLKARSLRMGSHDPTLRPDSLSVLFLTHEQRIIPSRKKSERAESSTYSYGFIVSASNRIGRNILSNYRYDF